MSTPVLRPAPPPVGRTSGPAPAVGPPRTGLAGFGGCSADPDALVALTAVTGPADDPVGHAAVALAGSLERLVAGSPDGRWPAGGPAGLMQLPGALGSLVAEGRRLDAEVRRTAAAFRQADGGGPFSTTGTAQEVGAAALDRAAARVAQRGGLWRHLGHTVLDVAQHLGRGLPRGVVAVSREVPLLSLALLPVTVALDSRGPRTWRQALVAATFSSVAGTAAAVGLAAIVTLALPATPALLVGLTATAAGIAVGMLADWAVHQVQAPRAPCPGSRPAQAPAPAPGPSPRGDPGRGTDSRTARVSRARSARSPSGG